MGLIEADPANAALLPNEPNEARRRENWEALRKGIAVNIPGVLAGRLFDLPAVLSLFARTIVTAREEIDADFTRHGLIADRSFRSKKLQQHRRAERLRTSLEWGQVKLLAHQMLADEAEILSSELAAFDSPFPGLANGISFSHIDLIELFSLFLHTNRDTLSEGIRRRSDAADVPLTEALVIAEVVTHYLGFATELDRVAEGFLEPTALQLQAWEVSAAALAKRIAA